MFTRGLFFFYFLFLFILLLFPWPSVHLLYCIFYLHPFSVKGYKTTSKVHVSLNLHTINHLVEPVLPWHQYLDWGLENHLLWQFHYYDLVQTEFLCIYVLRVATGPRVKLASCKSALNLPVVCSTDRSKAVVPVLVLLLVALWFILRSDLLYVFPCVILFLCFSVLLVLRLPRLGKRELILVLFVHLFELCLFRFVGFLFLLGSGKGCGLWLWHSLDFSLTVFCIVSICSSILLEDTYSPLP